MLIVNGSLSRVNYFSYRASVISPLSPHGVTATATLAESHIAIHTWPEYGYFAADLFFCGKGKPKQAVKVLQTLLQAQKIEVREFDRGFTLCSQAIAESDNFIVQLVQ